MLITGCALAQPGLSMCNMRSMIRQTASLSLYFIACVMRARESHQHDYL